MNEAGGLLVRIKAIVAICSILATCLMITPRTSAAEDIAEPVFPYDDVLIKDSDHAVSAQMAGAPPAPGFDDLSEYLMGKVAVGVVLLESNGVIDPSSEDWDSFRENEVKTEIETGLNWWAQQDARARLSFTFEYHMAVPTRYEPITHSGPFDEDLWINDAMSSMGYTTGGYQDRVKSWANHLRSSYRTDWAFAIFVVDSLNDADGRFTSGYSAYAWLGGPLFIMTYDNDGYGIGDMDFVAAHEMGHTFYATDEYNGFTERSGYLDVLDVESSGCIMHQARSWCISSGTLGQIGWRDTDGDNIFDILDEPPMTVLVPYVPDPTNDTTPTYVGTATVVALPNRNPNGPQNDVTISRITGVHFSFDLSPWYIAQANDGLFNSEFEGFWFMPSPLSSGLHIFFARATNTENNRDVNPPSDALTIDTAKPTSALRPFPSIVNTSLFTLIGDASDDLGVQLVDLFYSYEGGADQYLDTDNAEPWEWTVNTSLMNGDGNYSFYSVAVDLAWNSEDAPAAADVSVLVDTLPPMSSLDQLPQYSNQTLLSLTAHPLDVNGITSLEIWLDFNLTGSQHLTTLYSPPWTHMVDASLLGDGRYDFYARATDIAGNVEWQHAVPDASTIVDTGPPVATLDILPPYGNSMSFSVMGSASDVNGIAAVELWFRRDGGPWMMHSSDSAAPWRWDFDASSTGEGTYGFISVAVDNANNREQWPSGPETSTIIDVTPPSLEFTAPLPGVWINSTRVRIRWNGFDALSGVERYRIQAVGGDWLLPASTADLLLEDVDDGIHAATLTVWDRAGNTASLQMNVMIDATPPNLNLTAPGEGETVGSPATISWIGFDATSGLDHYRIRVDEGEFSIIGNVTSMILDLSPGTHTVTVRAYDVAGNYIDETISFSILSPGIFGDPGISVILPVLLGIVVAVAVLVAFLLLRRRKKDEESGEPKKT